jgi:sugar-specific transcriptional regulator TrmB
MSNEQGVQVLTGLGLTFCEAKVYLALTEIGKVPVRAISKASHVARQDSYRILSSLHKKGIVEKLIADPTMFRAIPIQDALSILWEKRKRQNSELHIKMKELLQQPPPEKEKQEEYTLTMISGGKTQAKKMEKVIHRTQVSLDIVGSTKLMTYGATFHHEFFRKAIERGVKIRIIQEEMEKERIRSEIWKSLKGSNFKLRYVHRRVGISAGIHDNKEVIIYVQPKDSMPPPAIRTNYPTFVKLCQNHFERTWQKAHEYTN